MSKVIITVGVSASGKSTFAKDWVSGGTCRVEVNRDTIRQMLTEKAGKKWCWENWNWKHENEVTAIANRQIELAIADGLDIIVSDTNLTAKYRNAMVKMFQDHGYEVRVKAFPITWEEAVKRDNKRVNGVGQSVLAKQFDQWNEFIGRKKYVADVTKPKAILVDIDGTLAHMNGKRGAFEWDKVDLDTVDEHVKMIVNSCHHYDVILLSGRDGCARTKTSIWLMDNLIRHDVLLMREPGDSRDDRIVKEELFWKYVEPHYNAQFVIDDRPKVCRMWRELGLKVFQVGNPAIEF